MSRKILLIDDEKDFLDLMEVRIKGWGYEFLKAMSGQEGVDAVKNENPDIVILDYMMPDMDGVETLKKIRRISKKIPVIMFTAYPDSRAMKDTQKLNIAAFIPKLSTYSDAQSSLKTALDMIEKRLGGR